MTVAKGLRDLPVASALAAAFSLGPPGWTRLEPQSVSGDPTPGLEARLHDPLWLLARQWQLGELTAEDAGSPVAVHVTTSTTPISAWVPGDPGAGAPARPLPASGLIEPAVEGEQPRAAGPSLLARADGGAQLLAQLADAGIDVSAGSAVLAAIVAACPLDVPWADPHDVGAPALAAILSGQLPDGEQAAALAAAGLAQVPPVAPPWLAAAPDAAGPGLAAVADWLAWYRGQVVASPDPTDDCWIDERLEYRFGLVAGARTFNAPAFSGGRVDWYELDAAPLPVAPPGPAPVAPPGPGPGPVVSTHTVLAAPLRFAGMPADRYWQFEDGQVNLGALEIQPHDLARLLLVEFATVYGADWLVAPVDVPLGSYTELPTVSYTTTFGEELTVERADDSGRSGRFRLFEVSVAGSTDTLPTDTLPGLFVPPSIAGVLDGPAVEEVLFLRDEMANRGWAVERFVEGPSGDTRNRHDEGYPPPFVPGTAKGAEMDYVLETEVPAWWIPFMPVATGYRTMALRKGAMLEVPPGGPPGAAIAVEPLGVLLRPGEGLTICDEEVPREGARVRRIPTVARGVDGSYLRWTTRRVTAGRGEGSSGLAFDSAVIRRPVAG